MQKEAAAIANRLNDKIDVFHAHDWLVATAGIGLKHVFRKPLLVTMHSTEMGRRDGIHNGNEKMIHETEAWLTYEAWKSESAAVTTWFHTSNGLSGSPTTS